MAGPSPKKCIAMARPTTPAAAMAKRSFEPVHMNISLAIGG